MFTVEIKTGGSAYRNEFNGELDETNAELIANLESIITKLRMGRTDGAIIDINGNKVGTFNLE